MRVSVQLRGLFKEKWASQLEAHPKNITEVCTNIADEPCSSVTREPSRLVKTVLTVPPMIRERRTALLTPQEKSSDTCCSVMVVLITVSVSMNFTLGNLGRRVNVSSRVESCVIFWVIQVKHQFPCH